MKGPAQSITAGGSDRDVHLVGGPRTIRAFRELGALDRLELVILPLLLGEGIALSPPGVPTRHRNCSDLTGPSPAAQPN
jgi:dihydrofolate reductase